MPNLMRCHMLLVKKNIYLNNSEANLTSSITSRTSAFETLLSPKDLMLKEHTLRPRAPPRLSRRNTAGFMSVAEGHGE